MKLTNTEALRALYQKPSFRAIKKELNALDKHAIAFLEKSPFCVIATYGKNGTLDNSPRGGDPGFVKVLNEKQIIIPDMKGNNRLDSLCNIIETGCFGSLFFLPGIDETLRINGTAYLSNDPELLSKFTENKAPITCIVVEIEEIFMHCAKALMRSKLWDSEHQLTRKEFPTMGQILKDQIGTKESPESQEDMVKRYLNDL